MDVRPSHSLYYLTPFHHTLMSDETPTAPETSEAVRILTVSTMQRVRQMVEELAGVALRDAKLDPQDGWRYDTQNGVYVKQ